MFYHVLDIFFVVFHSTLILFNITGWIWVRTRKLNLVTLLLTGASWLFLGLLVGTPGYCPLTDWHFRVLEKLGKADLPSSYIKYLYDRITGNEISPRIADRATLYVFIAAISISLFLNLRDLSSRKRNHT